MDASMTGVRRGALLVLALLMAAASALAAGGARPVGAHGLVDQQQPEGLGAASIIDSFEFRRGQEFVPSADNIVAVDLWLSRFDGNDTPTVTVEIREGAVDGPVVTATTRVVDLSAGSGVQVHFDFPAAAPLVPGQVYVIRAVSQGNAGWNTNDTGPGGDGGYAAGRLTSLNLLTGVIGFSDQTDHRFRTYFEEPLSIKLDALQLSVDAIEAKLDVLDLPDLSGLATQAQVEAVAAAVDTRASQASVDAIEAKLDALTFPDLSGLATQASVDDLATAVAGRASQSSVDAIEAKLDALSFPDVSGLATQASVDSLSAAVAAIEAKLDGLSLPDTSSLATKADIQALEAKLDQVLELLLSLPQLNNPGNGGNGPGNSGNAPGKNK